jgi:hypothetical protein
MKKPFAFTTAQSESNMRIFRQQLAEMNDKLKRLHEKALD